MTWIVVDGGRRTVGHGDTVAAFIVHKDGLPDAIEVSMYASDKAAKLLAERVVKALNLLDSLDHPETKPTFDEWFKAKYGMTFEDAHMRDGVHIAESMKALTRYMREYVCEMVPH